ncbi:M15 family metallopeptidase [Nocardioides massiliensis]|uniref:Peptidase M15C domain-containing protein n=1 Tax=Nocardioides massiliensis TaxID=1325935 RepID=A0ABT9NKZ7_9ACTN|nr:M15 family metallopeptidase [Nocardioides massiliensis]MDP9821083.1 hypothetical protein [Nocardioides massiliensis]
MSSRATSLPMAQATVQPSVRRAAAAAALGLAVLITGCTGTAPTPPSASTPTSAPTPTPDPTVQPTAPVPESPTAQPAPGTVPPDWLGTRVLPRAATGFGEVRRTPRELRNRRFTLPDTVAPLPGDGFASRVVDPAPQRVLRRSTWDPACPIGADELAWVRVAFRGFDGERHTGELLVASDVADDLVEVFGALFAADFPLEEMRVTTKREQTLPPTGDGNNTTAFNCRPVRGQTSWSEHAYGRAVDINPFHNPYVRETDAGLVVLPERAAAYVDRSRRAPGMVHADGPVVAAFRAIGWGWGGDYRSLKDYQHFSATGR